MTEKLKEKQSVWDFLANDNKPVVVYGMGNAAEKIIEALEKFDVKVSGIFASDEFVRGHSFLGFKVKKYSEICKEYSDFNIVLAFATHIDSVLEHIAEINTEHPVFAPDIPVAGGGLFTLDYITENEDKFDFVYNRLADEESRRVYLDILNYKISGKIDYLFGSFCKKNEIYKNILKLTHNETIADLGAYDGDTVKEFINFSNGKYRHIYALEPDLKNFKKLVKNTQNLPDISVYNIGAWSHRDTLFFDNQSSRNSRLSASGTPVEVRDIDSLIDDSLTMIKMDIEGSELKALEGAKKTIKKLHPKLYICAYHRNEDLFALPLKIWELDESYKIYFRHSKYIPAWESNFYCI